MTPGASQSADQPHRRRPRYSGKYPRRFEEKYKEQNPVRYSKTSAKVLAAGKTPAGTHRPIMVAEVLEILAPRPGEVAVDCTLGYGGHALELLRRIQPGGRLIGVDADPIELPKTEARLQALGFGPDIFLARRSNFAGLLKILAEANLAGVDIIMADLGVSSMQLDDPRRGFTFKHEGPLDMRMNPQRAETASALLARISPGALRDLLAENDEPQADLLATALAGRRLQTTAELVGAIRGALTKLAPEDAELAVRRVFQALRIVINDEFSALEGLLRLLPLALKPGGRVAVLTFHSGEDRRVKHAFAEGFNTGVYSEIARDVRRPTAHERFSNPRSAPAKLRWARRAAK